MSEAKTVKEVLVAAKWIIENVGWCQHSFAKDKDGRSVAMIYPDKIASACSLGAIELVKSSTDLKMKAVDLLQLVADENHRYSIADWNDNSTKEDVVKGFERAIKMASGGKR